ncbi:MAG: GNAT family N-acetyltransferase [Pseudomonadota bacterium]
MTITVEQEGVGAPDMVALLQLHLEEAVANSPACAVHALALEGLRAPGITFWTAREQGDLLGFGALLQLSDCAGEIKSMRTYPTHLRRGVGAMILGEIIDLARVLELKTLHLETGNTPHFHPAHHLYRQFGFEWSGAFADYTSSEFSRFMKLDLGKPADS